VLLCYDSDADHVFLHSFPTRRSSDLERGTKVVAAENGVVAYAGNELRGFGNLLLIKHADDWITAYAHNDRLLVNAGDSVTRGQRSEEHTSELQSRENLVCRLLLEKKN